MFYSITRKIQKALKATANKAYTFRIVPRTGFEPAHPCERCDLNTVRLPISPPGHLKSKIKIKKDN